jgi:hypothetical protein
MLSFIELNKPHIDLELYGTDTNIAPIDKVHIMDEDSVVEYSLSGYQNPIGVADWQNQLTQSLPEEFQSSLPSIEEIEKELE